MPAPGAGTRAALLQEERILLKPQDNVPVDGEGYTSEARDHPRRRCEAADTGWEPNRRRGRLPPLLN
eukprot:7518708-Alexandrium_andersonii.AAC.1